ncbi:hypothetical protein PanWU01x14_210280 [Parasponia andersonii]|uniref:Uncharacterized protein n=1 Tax=Parasponia andersonii TaxID=3476 RepID=A0A2P5BU39_PARAD|nr:hypothetical protein PanWU01x14_210280 [Parasponia andersonii]
MAEECSPNVDAGMTKQKKILADDQETKSESTTPEKSSCRHRLKAVNKDILRVTNDKELFELIMKKEENNESWVQQEKDYHKIGWTSKFLRRKVNHLKNYCNPSEFSVGPFHTNDRKLLKKELKFKLTAAFIESFSKDKTGEGLLEEIKKIIEDLKKCYVEWVISDEYNDDSLARLLFLDGCAVLQFIYSYIHNKLEEFGIDNHQASLIREDLFLLRNQIPFRVLELLISMCYNPNQLKSAIVNFLHMNNMMASVNYELGHKQLTSLLEIKSQNVHLLELLHSLFILGDDGVSSEKDKKDGDTTCCPCYHSQKENNCCLPRFTCFHKKRPSLEDFLQDGHHNYNNKRFFRNVKELKSAGIEFKPSSGLATVSFSSRCFNIRGHLRLPPVTVDEGTERKLMNLVAYEMCLGGSKKNWYFVTSYIELMDFLIDNEQDVKELRASSILWNRLSSDKDVANLFNCIGSYCFAPPHDVYSHVKTEIQTHCERKCAIWMAQVYHEHFSSPWTVMAFLAALIVLSLTAVQTWFAIQPK